MLGLILFILSFCAFAFGSFVMDVEAQGGTSAEKIAELAKAKGFELIGFKQTPEGKEHKSLRNKASVGLTGTFLFVLMIDSVEYTIGADSFYLMLRACDLIVRKDGKELYRITWGEKFTVEEKKLKGKPDVKTLSLPADKDKIPSKYLSKLAGARSRWESKHKESSEQA